MEFTHFCRNHSKWHDCQINFQPNDSAKLEHVKIPLYIELTTKNHVGMSLKMDQKIKKPTCKDKAIMVRNIEYIYE